VPEIVMEEANVIQFSSLIRENNLAGSFYSSCFTSSG
jgi:hypothetical protein